MIETIARSYRIFRESLKVLGQDKEILIFPALAGLAWSMLLAGATATGLLLGSGRGALESLDAVLGGWSGYAIVFAWYLANWFIGLFFNVAVLHCAKMRFDGKDPAIRDGLHAAWSHVGRIAAWAVVSATVGVIAAVVRERAGFLLRLFTGAAELAWAIATFFVVPVLIFEERPVGDSIRQSLALIRKTWGESLAGTGGLAAFSWLLAALGLVPLTAGIASGSGPYALSGVLLALGWWLLVMCVATALGGIYRAALYVYATEQRIPAALSEDTVAGAFRARA